MKRNECEHCHKSFIPSRNHPNQGNCGSEDCLRESNRKRQRRFYRKKCQEDSDWEKAMRRRKKRERLERLNRASPDNTSTASKSSVILEPEYEPLILGILSALTGYHNRDDLLPIYQHCLEKGMSCLSIPESRNLNNNGSFEGTDEQKAIIINQFPNVGLRVT